MKNLLICALIVSSLTAKAQEENWSHAVGHGTSGSIVYITPATSRDRLAFGMSTEESYRAVYKELKDLPKSNLEIVFFRTKQLCNRNRLKLEREFGYSKIKVVMLEYTLSVEADPNLITD